MFTQVQQVVVSQEDMAAWNKASRLRRADATIHRYISRQLALQDDFSGYMCGTHRSTIFSCYNEVLLEVDERGQVALPGIQHWMLGPDEVWLPVDASDRNLVYYRCQRIKVGRRDVGFVWSAALGRDLPVAQQHLLFGPDGQAVARENGDTRGPLHPAFPWWVQHPDGIWEGVDDLVIAELQLHHYDEAGHRYPAGMSRTVPRGRQPMPVAAPAPAPASAPIDDQMSAIPFQDGWLQVAVPAGADATTPPVVAPLPPTRLRQDSHQSGPEEDDF
ncbi:hypothetical protein T440DRAFT_517553 [Plenodomus tracheiphilus IPT5]|uniref:Uncharacterized protein n=1 Tax=Plenodomus tracheiphilus IPT5 TaxID=1408161 RepID=A0A6A7B7Q4_9PLEO|nr:hypothetical protein T440DRAFT_517553 [Plenodomus tracheiphilus IPT5]